MDDSRGGNAETLGRPRAGIISRIRLENFMCHSNLEIELGEWVNFITGQNGSGKSAILTALCVAFGCRAKGTQRASTLKDFIKTGCSSAVIQIQLKNHGDDAFKPDIYGDTISIERRLSESSSTTLLKDCYGKKVASRKEELRELVEHFNIDVENPCVIMTQDKSREFLHSGNSKEKFKFFYKASLLQQVDELLESIHQQLVSADTLIGELEATIRPIVKELEQLEEKIKNMERLDKIFQQLQQLKKKLAWSWVYDVDKNLQEQCVKIEKLKDRIPACQAKIDEQQNILEKLRECFTEKKTQVDNLMKATIEVKKSKAELQDRLTLAKKERNELAQEHDREAKQIQKTKMHVQSLQEQIREIHELELKNTQNEERELRSKVSELQNEIDEANEMLNRMREEEDQLTENLNVKMTEVQDIASEIEKLETRRRGLASNIKDLIQHQTTKVTAFGGNKVIHLLRVIEKYQGRFGRPPIGPIGCHLSLKDGETWGPAVEEALGKLLNAFIVTSHKDSLVLRQCAKEAYYTNLRIIIYDFSRPRLNIPPNMLPRIDHLTMTTTTLSVLLSENVTVLNVLVDMGNIEKQVLVKDYEAGKTVAFSSRYSNVKEVYTIDGYKMFSRKGVETILPPIGKARTSRLCSSYDNQIAELEKDAKQAEQLVEQQKLKKREADSMHNNIQENLHRVKKRCMMKKQDLTSKQLALKDIKKSLEAEATSPTSTVDELHQEISIIEDQMKEKETISRFRYHCTFGIRRMSPIIVVSSSVLDE